MGGGEVKKWKKLKKLGRKVEDGEQIKEIRRKWREFGKQFEWVMVRECERGRAGRERKWRMGNEEGGGRRREFAVLANFKVSRSCL